MWIFFFKKKGKRVRVVCLFVYLIIFYFYLKKQHKKNTKKRRKKVTQNPQQTHMNEIKDAMFYILSYVISRDWNRCRCLGRFTTHDVLYRTASSC